MCAFLSVMLLFLPVTFAEVLPCPNKDLQTIRLGYVSKKYTFGFDGTSGAGYDINQGCNWKFVATDSSTKVLYKLTKIYVDCGDVLKVDTKTVCCSSSSSSSDSGCPQQGESINDAVTASNELQVTFQADSTKRDNGREGFTLLLTVGKDPTSSASCDGSFVKMSISGGAEVLITSPNFPSFYANNLNCGLRIEAEAGNRVSFKFIFLQLDPSDSLCKNDKIDFYDGDASTTELKISTTCGNTAPYEIDLVIKSIRRHLYVRFTTDGSVAARGFTAVVSQIVDGVWSPWGGWTSCSKTCGSGTRTRMRTCSNPPPSNGGTTCTGSPSGSEQCNTQNCPVDGAWSPWGGWTTCSETCGSGKRTRIRTCSNPPPSNGGTTCSGSSSGSEQCNTQNCPVDGVWSPWGGWTTCSETCGGGTRTRIRTCSNPPPSNGGTTCSGSSSGSEQCNNQNCPATTSIPTATVATTATTATVETTAATATVATTEATVATTKPSITTPPGWSPPLPFILFAIPISLANLILLFVIYQLIW